MIKKKNLTGTARYASINALNGLTQSRRDDLEAVGYVLLYFLRGKLPWQGLHVKNKEDRYHRIMEIKIETKPHQLCKGFPIQFEQYVDYTRKLEYEEDPDYDYLKNLFHLILKEDKNNMENIYDWDNKTLYTNTTNNTSQKALFIKDRENNDKNNNFIDGQNLLEFERRINKAKIDRIEEHQLSLKAKNTNEGFYNSQIIQRSELKNIIKTEGKIVSFKNKNIFKDEEKDENEDIINLEYQNIMDLTEEGKDDDINKCPKVSGVIHCKNQIDNNINSKRIKKEEDNGCYIF
jgi:hypothetical protein